MILITGGLGFIGLHTARALIDAGEQVVLTQYRVARKPSFIADRDAAVEQLDITDAARLQEIGKKYKITGIVHLAAPAPNALNLGDETKLNMDGLLNILQAAQQWECKRVGLASSGTVYGGVSAEPGSNNESMNLSVAPAVATPTWKKCFEIIGGYWASRSGMNIVNLRIGTVYGPLYHTMMNLPSRLIHAAAKNEPPQIKGDVYAEDGMDFTYVKDCGKGIALLMTAEKLGHSTYNVGSGRATTHAELVSAIQRIAPSFNGDFLKPGRSPQNSGNRYADLSRIKGEVGYEPQYPVQQAVADYIGWLKEGNPQ